MNNRHTLSVLVENKPGVLTRFNGLIARRGFNIHSLAVGVTERDELSRITVVVDVNDVPLEQVTKQLNKLVNVIEDRRTRARDLGAAGPCGLQGQGQRRDPPAGRLGGRDVPREDRRCRSGVGQRRSHR